MAHFQLHSLFKKMLNFYSYVGLTEATVRNPRENGNLSFRRGLLLEVTAKTTASAMDDHPLGQHLPKSSDLNYTQKGTVHHSKCVVEKLNS